MKKHNIVKIVLITILVFLLLSWILPAAYYSGQYIDQGRVQMGLYELFNYPLTSISYFGYIALFIIFVGGFYGVLYKIPAYRTFLDKIVSIFNGKEKVFISLVVILLAVGVSFCGLQLAYIFFIPFLVALILLMGYDKNVAAMTIVGSVAVGMIGSTYAYSNLNVLTSTLSLKLDYQIGVRIVILIVGIFLVIFNTLSYIKKYMSSAKKVAPKEIKSTIEDVTDENKVVSKDKSTNKKSTSTKKGSTTKVSSKATKPTKSKPSTSKSNTKAKSSRNNKAALRDEDIIVVKESVIDNYDNDKYLVPTRVEATHKVWPFVCGFILLFILVVLAFVAWGEGGFGLSLFDDITKSVSEFKIFGFPLFAKLYGTMNSFGTWTIIDLFLPISLLLTILVIIYKVSFDDLLDGFANGVRKALLPAFISVLIYTCLVLVTYHPYQLTIYKALLGIGKGFNIVTTLFVSILASLFNGDISYVSQSVIPYYTSVVTNTDNYSIVGVIFQSMYGFTMLFAPTSLILMSTLAYLKVSYKDWIKNIWKLLLELFIILLIVFIILALI